MNYIDFVQTKIKKKYNQELSLHICICQHMQSMTLCEMKQTEHVCDSECDIWQLHDQNECLFVGTYYITNSIRIA